MRIAVIHQEVPDDAPADERDVLEQAQAVSESLARHGHEVETWTAALDLGRLREQLRERRPDLIFNLVESLGGSDRLIAAAPMLWDALRIPYTGASSQALAVSSHKVLAKQWLADAGLPTAEWLEGLDRGQHERRPPFLPGVRYIVKSIAEHASFGLDDSCVVEPRDAEHLAALVAEFEARVQRPAFAERFIAGREFNVALLAGPRGPEALPVAEILFRGYAADRPKIVCYKAKWAAGEFEYVNTPRTFEFPPSDEPLLDELRRLAQAAWRRFGLHGYARVDFRVDGEGNPWILEVNANPCIAPDAGFAAMLEQAGVSYDEAIARIVADAGVEQLSSTAPDPHGER